MDTLDTHDVGKFMGIEHDGGDTAWDDDTREF